MIWTVSGNTQENPNNRIKFFIKIHLVENNLNSKQNHNSIKWYIGFVK